MKAQKANKADLKKQQEDLNKAQSELDAAEAMRAAANADLAKTQAKLDQVKNGSVPSSVMSVLVAGFLGAFWIL